MANTTKRDLMLSTWRRLGAAPVGRKELREIQKVLQAKFGSGGVQSPASIARVLADEGAELRHPEIIRFDSDWRESQIENEAKKFRGVKELLPPAQLNLKQAEALISKLEQLRNRFEREGAQEALTQLRTLAADARRAAQLLAKVHSSDHTHRSEQSEIAEWLKVWIQTPNLFADWIELRKRSPEFRRKFVHERD